MIEGKVKRGTYGYISYRKKQLGIITIIFVLLIVALIAIGWIIIGKFKNGFLIPAMILVAPFANFFASFMSVVSFKSAPMDKYSQVRNFDDEGMLLSDIILVNEKGKRFAIEFIVVHKGGMIAYSSYVKKDAYIPETHVNNILDKRGIPMRFKIVTDFDEFLQKIDGVYIGDDESDKQNLELARQTIINTSM